MRPLMIPMVLLAALPSWAQEKVHLRHGGKRGQEWDVTLQIHFGVAFEGDPDSIDMLRSLSPFFAFETVTLEGPAEHKILRAPKDGPLRHWIRFERAVAEGVYDGEEFQYTFGRGKKEDDLEEDKLKQTLYAIFMGGRRFELSRTGEFRDLNDENKDPNGEAMDHLISPFPRFPRKPVAVGGSWTVRWTSRTKEKDHGGRIEFTEKGTLQSLEDGRAVIVLELSGKDTRGGKEANGNTNEIRVHGRATVHLDVESGRVLQYDSSGEVRVHVSGFSPDLGVEYDATIILKAGGRLKPRR